MKPTPNEEKKKPHKHFNKKPKEPIGGSLCYNMMKEITFTSPI